MFIVELACSRRSDSKARLSMGSELNCTPGKQRGGGELREFFSRALLSERLEQAIVARDSNLATTTSYVFQGGSSSGGRGGG